MSVVRLDSSMTGPEGECNSDLFADTTSCQQLPADQAFRTVLSILTSIAHVATNWLNNVSVDPFMYYD